MNKQRHEDQDTQLRSGGGKEKSVEMFIAELISLTFEHLTVRFPVVHKLHGRHGEHRGKVVAK